MVDSWTYGQYVECFFLNSDGTIDVQTMVHEVQRQIDTGCMSLIQAFDPHRHFARNDGQRTHPAFATRQTIRAQLEQIYGGYIEEDNAGLDYVRTNENL